MDDKIFQHLLDGNTPVLNVVKDLNNRYGYVFFGLGACAIAMGTCGFIVAGSTGASFLGGIGGAIGGFAGAKEQDKINRNKITWLVDSSDEDSKKRILPIGKY